MIVAKNKEPETNEIDFKDVDEISDQRQLIKNNQMPEPNERSLKGGSEMPNQAKNIANNPETELNKIYRTNVIEVFDQENIYSKNQNPVLSNDDNKDNHETSDGSKIDSNSQEEKPNYIKHDPGVALTKRQRILEWGRRMKSRVTKTFNRLLGRPIK